MKRMLRALLFPLGGILALAASPVSAQDSNDIALTEIQSSARQWIDLRLETSRLEADWAWERELLQSTLTGLEDRCRQLRERAQHLTAENASEAERIAAKEAERQELRAAVEALEGHTDAAIARLRQMRTQLPPRLSRALNLAYENLEDPNRTPGERLQTVVSMANRCTEFNQMVTFSEEVVAGDSAERVMQVLYCGLSHAYALDETAETAYLGRPSEGGWRWQEQPGQAAALRELLEIFQETRDPALVQVPTQTD